MKKASQNSKQNTPSKAKEEEKYNLNDYPASEDIYNKFRKASDINPEDISQIKETIIIDTAEKRNEKDFKDDKIGGDLDIPGSELDNDQELIGSEDEENNYYSLGDDNHNDSEEDTEK